MKKEIKKFLELINSSDKILLINHVRMDPDSFGSLGALYYVLKEIGKEVKAINDEKVPADFSFLGGDKIIEPKLNLKKFNPDLIISLDAASISQLGLAYEENKEIFEKTNLVVIDHHISNIGFGKINLIDSKSSSTCELLYEILDSIKFKKHITPKIASFLITGIITDTNIFYNTNTSSKTLKIASKLLELGADIRSPIKEFYRKKTFNKTKLWGEVLKDLKKSEDGKIIYATIKKEIFKKTNTTDNETSGLINEFLANIEGSEVSFLLYELEDKKVKASFRSNGFDVSKLCTEFGGGGHKQAGGFISNKKIEIVEKEILDKLKNNIK